MHDASFVKSQTLLRNQIVLMWMVRRGEPDVGAFTRKQTGEGKSSRHK